MKTKISIILLSLTLATMQACGPTAKNDEESTGLVSEVSKHVKLTLDERRAKIQKEKNELEQKRLAAYTELVKASPYYKSPSGTLVYYKAETAPSFIGGDKAMGKFLKDNLVYPAGAQYAELEGTVFVDFIVSANGEVRNTEVTSYTYEDVDPAFTAESLRVVKMMPRWSPGLQNGKPVDVKFSIPITFQLN